MSPPQSSAPAPGASSEKTARLLETFARFVPHNRALGIAFVSLAAGRVTLALPYDEKLVGNPLTGVVHGGAITGLLDAACGMAVHVKLGLPIRIATLDLRIDYLGPATPGKEVHACAECFRVTRNVAFVRCEAFHGPHVPGSAGPLSKPEDELVAVANGTFILFRGSAPGGPGSEGASG
jgi:uncharacterized protein (TIGR00369 family)